MVVALPWTSIYQGGKEGMRTPTVASWYRNRAKLRSYGPPMAHVRLCLFRAIFNWVSKVIRASLWFCFTSFCDWLKISCHFLDQSEVNLQPIAPCSHAFSCAWAGFMYLLRVLIGLLGNLSLLWLAGGNYFGFGFTTLVWKALWAKTYLVKPRVCKPVSTISRTARQVY